MWDKILAYYEEMSQMPREGEMWDSLRHHCRKIQELIPKIQAHSGLAELKHHISVHELCLVNPDNERGALIFMGYNDAVRIIFYKLGELADIDKSREVHVHLSDVIQVLASNLPNDDV
jgi:hypothetical protein